MRTRKQPEQIDLFAPVGPSGTRVPEPERRADQGANVALGRILKAARELKARGTRIVAGEWGIRRDGKKWVLHGDCCCALAALLVVEKVPAAAETETGHASCRGDVARALGVDGHRLDYFINGYDGTQGWDLRAMQDPWWHAGQDARAALVDA